MRVTGHGVDVWGRHERQRYRPRLVRVRWIPRRRRFMLITGAAGFLGRHLVMASEAEEWELFAPPASVIDVRQRDRVIEEICT